MLNSAKQSRRQWALLWCVPVPVLAKQQFLPVALLGEHCLALQILKELWQ
jgi:hypothetical protein